MNRVDGVNCFHSPPTANTPIGRPLWLADAGSGDFVILPEPTSQFVEVAQPLHL